jgi:hypothetical protein
LYRYRKVHVAAKEHGAMFTERPEEKPEIQCEFVWSKFVILEN